MTYAQNQTIAAADYNSFRSSVSLIYSVGTGDKGYGQTAIVQPAVLGGGLEFVKSLEWTNLRDAIELCANHQGSSVTIPTTGDVAQDATIYAHSGLATAVTTITNNRTTAAVGSMTLFTNQYSNSTAASWDTSIDLVFSATWSSGDAARYFFNSGGQIRLTPSRIGGADTLQNRRWQHFLERIGTVVFSAHATTCTGTTPGASAKGYFELTTGYQLVFGVSEDDQNQVYDGIGYDYSYPNVGLDNDFTIEVLSNGTQGSHADNGSVLTFRVIMRDDVFNAGSPISGTTSVVVDERRATTYLTGISGASYSTLDAL